MESWWCVDCRSAVELSQDGRCGSCASDAVDSTARSFASSDGSTAVLMTPLLAQLA